MAKKKSTTQTENNPQKPQNHQSMDNSASEKIDSLKSLNSMLLKETVERRQQVDSLIQSNSSLESQLNRSVAEKVNLESELKFLNEREAMLEIESGLVCVFVSEHVNQLAEFSGNERGEFCRARILMEERIESLEGEFNRVLAEKIAIENDKSEMESKIKSLKMKLDALVAEICEQKVVSARVCEERDDVRAQLDARIHAENELRLKLIEAEKRETEILKEVSKLKVDYDSLFNDKTVTERKLDLILKEKDLVERNLVESNGVVDELKRDIKAIVKEKKSFEEEKNTEVRKNEGLLVSVHELNEAVESLKKEEKALLEKVSQLEKKCVESSGKEAEMLAEIGGLVEEKKVTEGNVWRLTEEKSLVLQDLVEAREMLEHQKLTAERISQEKTEIEKAKIQGESEIVTLKEQLAEFKDTILSLEKCHITQMNEIKQLNAEVNRYKAAFDQATIDRNGAKESLDKEKTTGTRLREQLSKAEKEIEQVRKELVKMTAENDKLVGEKGELRNHCGALVKDVTSVEKRLSGTQNEINDLKAKLELAEANLKMVLEILKNTSSIYNSKEDDYTVLDHENGFGEEIKHHVTEVEAIKRAFKDRESRMEEMKRQLESLKNSVVKANKGKSFWTLVSSATTLFAAASLAYVARGH